MVRYIVKFLKAINTNVNPGEIAHGAACGVLLGLMPKNNLFWYIIFFILLFIRINKAVYLIIIPVASFFTPFLDPTFDSIGFSVLTNEKLYDIYNYLLNIPFVAFTKFNNTIVMGSFISGLVLYLPAYLIARLIVYLWRKRGANALRKSKLMIAVNKIPLVSKISELMEKDWEVLYE